MPRISCGCYWIGIDPGVSGGLAAIDGSGCVDLLAKPATDQDVWQWLCLKQGGVGFSPAIECFAVIEQNTGYVGGAGNPGSAMFKFGCSHGMLEGFLVAASIPYEQITPGQWQRALGIQPRRKGKGKESKTQFKNRLKQRAQQLFPGKPITLATADAVLIAYYCRLKQEGRLAR